MKNQASCTDFYGISGILWNGGKTSFRNHFGYEIQMCEKGAQGAGMPVLAGAGAVGDAVAAAM